MSFEFLTGHDIDRDAMDVFGDKRDLAQDVFVEKLPSFWNRFVHVNIVFRLKRYCNTKQHYSLSFAWINIHNYKRLQNYIRSQGVLIHNQL